MYIMETAVDAPRPAAKSSTSDTFTALAEAFALQVADLKEVALLRIDDAARDMYAEDLGDLEVTVRAVEQKLRQIRACVQRERDAIPKVHLVLEACRQQREHLQYIAAHLPPFLPAAPDAEHRAGAAPEWGANRSQGAAGGDTHDAGPAAPATVAQGAAKENAQPSLIGAGAAAEAPDRRQRPPAPRRYVTQAELASLSAYMRGRLTADKVNAAVDDVAAMGEANLKLMLAVRSNSRTLPAAERKRGQTLLHSVSGKEGVKGHYWFLEHDMRDGPALKLDRTGKSILMLLRHLGRLQEVRINVDGSFLVVHVLQ